MRILSVAYPLAPVSLNSVGGAEQVLAMVERAIVAAGHQSVVVAMEGSMVAGRLCAVQRCEGALDESAKRRAQASVRDAIAAAGPVDLIHMHGIDFLEYLPRARRAGFGHTASSAGMVSLRYVGISPALNLSPLRL